MPDQGSATQRNGTQQVAHRTPCACPFCGHDGAFDAMGQFCREVETIRPDSPTTIVNAWYTEIHCPDCDSVFAMAGERR